MTSKRQSLTKLSEIISNDTPANNDMLLRNVFACACYLSTINEKEASQKLLGSLLDQLGWEKRKTYFLDLKNSLSEFSKEYAEEISANVEINNLFR